SSLNFKSMKKHLFTCFLASLCLYGRSLLAQVADSPGSDFLHRSMPHVSTEQGGTHRGRIVRSDTLNIGDQIPEGIEFSSVLKLAGNSINLDQLQGEYKVLHFWATSCSASLKS